MTSVDASKGVSAAVGPYAVDERFWEPVDVDPITLTVIGGALDAIAKEMAQALYRMAWSSLIRESEDMGAGIFDPTGREFCESDSTPMHIGSIPAYIRGINRRLAGTYQPGDVILHNDPYHGAAHTPDYGVFIPVFHEGRHIAFAGCTGHLADVGGSTPGLSIDAIDVFAEGKILDAVRLETAGVRNEDLFTHVLGNVRSPTSNAGDVEAMISSCRLGARRYSELIDRYGLDVVMSSVEAWMDRSEATLRVAISELPDGIYTAPDGWLDDDGRHRGTGVRVATTVIVEGDELVVDLTGSNDEVETAINAPFEGSVLPTANFAVRTVFLDEAKTDEFIPQNDGIFRPVRVIAPEGSIYNPRFPRACSGRFPAVNRIPDQINLALAEAAPDLITAGNSAALHALAYSGFDPQDGEYWIYLEVAEGSYGGRSGKDGLDAVDNLMANTRNNPIEEMEMRVPMRCLTYGLREHPPSAGRYRGGLGSIRTWEVFTPTVVSASGDSRLDVPRGLFGGTEGRSGRVVRNLGRTDEEAVYSKFAALRLDAGDTLTVEVPSGAGYGDPLDRDPDAVLRDVRNQFYTAQEARELYGIVLTPDGTEVDRVATERTRTSRRDIATHNGERDPAPRPQGPSQR